MKIEVDRFLNIHSRAAQDVSKGARTWQIPRTALQGLTHLSERSWRLPAQPIIVGVPRQYHDGELNICAAGRYSIAIGALFVHQEGSGYPPSSGPTIIHLVSYGSSCFQHGSYTAAGRAGGRTIFTVYIATRKRRS